MDIHHVPPEEFGGMTNTHMNTNSAANVPSRFYRVRLGP